jgi:site-specific recombinase XerD
MPFGAGTRRALERYIRLRDDVLAAACRPIHGLLWIGALRKDRLTASGIAQMLEHRCEQAGIARISPYELRYTFARRH